MATQVRVRVVVRARARARAGARVRAIVKARVRVRWLVLDLVRVECLKGFGGQAVAPVGTLAALLVG